MRCESNVSIIERMENSLVKWLGQMERKINKSWLKRFIKKRKKKAID